MENVIEELTESFLNGSITSVMEALEEMSKFDAMISVLQIYNGLTSTQKESFYKAILSRSSVNEGINEVYKYRW